MLSIRVLPDDLERWKAAAKADDCSLTELVCEAVNRSVARKRRKGG
jgi:predicted HicB family RNase H-like nuclease